ncbi:MAG: LptF/LptG family permease [Thermodesulfovibrionales bacterium]
MRLLERHYLGEFLRLFALVSAGLSAILSALELIRRMDDFSPHGPSLWDLALYAALVFPRYLVYLIPAAALICSLYTVSHAARARETVAFVAAGGRMKRLLLPFVATGLALSAAGFALGEFVVPEASRQAADLRRSIMEEKRSPALLKEGVVWMRARDGSIVKIDFYMPEDRSYRGMSVFRIEEDGLREVIYAREARYLGDGDLWLLRGVRRYDTDTGRVEEVAELRYDGIGSPGVVTEDVQKPYETGIVELSRYLRRLREAGFRNQRLEVEMNSKVSFPLVSLFMVIIGVSFSARKGVRGLAAAAIGLVISLAYWFGYTMALSLGYAGILPPLAAAWIVPAAFAALGADLYRKIPE